MIPTAFESNRVPSLALVAILPAVALFVVAFVLLLFVRRHRHFQSRTPVVYHLKGCNLRITFTHLDQDQPVVIVVLGSETRTFELLGFIDSWRDLLEVGRQAIDAHMEMTSSGAAGGKDRGPTSYQLERNNLSITFTCLDHKKPEIGLALGTEARRLRFEEFIDFWQDTIKIATRCRK